MSSELRAKQDCLLLTKKQQQQQQQQKRRLVSRSMRSLLYFAIGLILFSGSNLLQRTSTLAQWVNIYRYELGHEPTSLKKDDDDDNNNNKTSQQLPRASQFFQPQQGVPEGILSTKPVSYFRSIQQTIDDMDLLERCQQYGFINTDGRSTTTTITTTTVAAAAAVPQRRIFYGSLLADEPWELLEIIAAETHGIFAGMVFVESNRTQHFHPRPLQRVGQEKRLGELFGTPRLQVRTYTNEDPRILDLWREHEQREEILKGWKELGMTERDLGLLTDTDETFTRDFLRAVQECPDIAHFDHSSHYCNPFQARMIGAARVFESSPDCVTRKRVWHHPDLIVGACIEGIGDADVNPVAPRDYFVRADGYGGRNGRASCSEEGLRKVKDNQSYPLYNAADFRSMCGGQMIRNRNSAQNRTTEYTAFHFHNWFANFNQTRFKYKTYGHPHGGAYTAKLEDLNEDLALSVRCASNTANKRNGTKIREREQDGLKGTLPPWPVYFHDNEYRIRKATALRDGVIADEVVRQAYRKESEQRELARRAKLLRNSKIITT